MADIAYSDASLQDKLPDDKVGRFLFRWSQFSAVIAVLLLLFICLISTISVISRWLFNSPITGDVELVQIACALAISAFLPYAQMKNAHVIVDFFTVNAPLRFRQFLDLFAALLLAGVAILLTWRSAVGAISTYRSKTSTMILALPEWLSHLTIAPGFALLSLTALYTAYRQYRSLREKHE